MSFSHSVGVLYRSAEGTIANTTETNVGNMETGLDVVVPNSTTDQVEPIAVDVSRIQSFCMYSSATALTIKTYASAVLKQTLVIAAGQQETWTLNSPFTNPLTDDFDTIKLTNADGIKSTTFKFRCLQND